MNHYSYDEVRAAFKVGIQTVEQNVADREEKHRQELAQITRENNRPQKRRVSWEPHREYLVSNNGVLRHDEMADEMSKRLGYAVTGGQVASFFEARGIEVIPVKKPSRDKNRPKKSA